MKLTICLSDMIREIIDIIAEGDISAFARSIQANESHIQRVLEGAKPKYWLIKRIHDYHHVNPLYMLGHSKIIFLNLKP